MAVVFRSFFHSRVGIGMVTYEQACFIELSIAESPNKALDVVPAVRCFYSILWSRREWCELHGPAVGRIHVCLPGMPS